MRTTTSLLVVAALVAVVSACAPTTGGATASPTAASTPSVDASAVNAAMAHLATVRAELENEAHAALAVAVRVNGVAQGLRSPSTIDTVLDDVPRLDAEADAVAPDRIAALRVELDAALDDADAALLAALAEAGPGSWQERFLVAQQDVVAALRGWSATHVAVEQLLADHWDVLHGVVDAAAVLDHDRWRYRTPEEAAGTWEIEVAGDLGPLASADAAVPPVVAERDAAAALVREADGAAAAVFADRPTSP